MTLFDGHLPPAVDMHCHLGEAGGYGDTAPDALLVAVTNDPDAWKLMSRQESERVTWAAGLHPCAQRENDPRLDQLLELLPAASAIGEIGLDYSRRATASHASQRQIFDSILASEAAKDRLLTIHSVAATADVTAALVQHRPKGAVLHWFLGTAREVDRLLDLDTYFSINSAMFRSRAGRLAISEMPPNRVLAETDAPFVKRGKQTLRPGEVEPVEHSIAKLWDIDTDEARRRLWRNFLALNARLSTRLFPLSKLT